MPQNITMIPGKDYDGTTIDGLIYQNGPENIVSAWLDTAAFGRAFTYIPLTVGKVYEVEFYNWNYAGTGLHLGFGLKNNSTTSGQVTVLKQAIRVSSVGSGTPYPNSQYLGQEMTLAFMQDTRNDIVSIPGNTGATQGFKSLLSSTFFHGQLINGRIRFMVNSGASLYAKVFFVDSSKSEWEKFAGWTNLLSAADLDLIDPGTSQKFNLQFMATGLYSNIKRGMSIPNTNPIQIAYGDKDNTANVIIDRYNTNEFETPTYPINVRKGNLGNYGIVYTPYCSVTTAKYFKITPKAIAPKDGRYVIKENGIWKQANATPVNPYKGALTAGTSFWFVLAGGNTGNVEIVFSTTPF